MRLGICAGDVWYYTVHLGWWKDEEEPFADQWNILAAAAGAKPLAFLLGDFNSEADVRGEGYDLILRSGWQDTYRLARQRDDGYTVVQAIDGWRDAPDAAAKKRIDQIWCSESASGAQQPGGIRRKTGASGLRPCGRSDRSRTIRRESRNMQRSAGILLPVSSLPSPYGIGCFSQEAYDFVDWLKDAGQTYWQILPLGVTSYGDSPYQSFSAFAGNPYFISLDELVKEGVLTAEECKKAKFGRKADDIDYSQLYKERGRLLRLAYSRSDIGHNAEFAAFCEQNKWWLDDFALFMAVKDRFEGKPWIEWAEDIRLRWQNAMDYYRRELYFEVEYYKYLQFKFDQQWRALKAYANEKGIRIIGDIPIYVALDSADAWANPQMFQLDEDNIPTAVAGVPPDGFSPTGQLWGNPLYRWEKHRETGYQWWITRLWYCFELYDVVRIDHFRGFDEYFSIPYGSETAAPGHWEKGPGIELFRAVEQALGKREIIAEDLGYMSETVRQLVRDSGFPGMKVLEFAFDSRDTGSASDYLPHNYPVNSVAYTGTHDNETLASWYQTITSAERALVRDYLCDYATPEAQLYKSMIALIFRSAAATCIIPMQDWLGLDNSARINKPSTVGENWRWRLKKSQLTPKLQKEICSITTRYGRMNWA